MLSTTLASARLKLTVFGLHSQVQDLPPWSLLLQWPWDSGHNQFESSLSQIQAALIQPMSPRVELRALLCFLHSRWEKWSLQRLPQAFSIRPSATLDFPREIRAPFCFGLLTCWPRHWLLTQRLGTGTPFLSLIFPSQFPKLLFNPENF